MCARAFVLRDAGYPPAKQRGREAVAMPKGDVETFHEDELWRNRVEGEG